MRKAYCNMSIWKEGDSNPDDSGWSALLAAHAGLAPTLRYASLLKAASKNIQDFVERVHTGLSLRNRRSLHQVPRGRYRRFRTRPQLSPMRLEAQLIL